MQVSMKSIVATSVLSLASMGAFAANGPIPDPIAGPGGYILSAWDPVANVGTTTYLGSTLTDFNTTVNSTYSVDMSVFAGNTTNVIYSVVAADYQGLTSSPLDWQLAFTSNATVAPAYSGQELGAGASSVQGHVGRVNLACGTAPKCDATGANPWFPGNPTFTTNLNAALPFNTTASVGTALNFYIMTGASDLLDDPAGVVHVGTAGASFASFTLTSDGTLSYNAGGGGTPVPLPAAVWLLLSGIGGLSAVGRRRRSANA